MKGDIVATIGINSGGGNNRPFQISADMFDGDLRRTGVGFSPDIKANGMVFISLIFDLIKGRTKLNRKSLKGPYESEAKELIIKMFVRPPCSEIPCPTLGERHS